MPFLYCWWFLLQKRPMGWAPKLCTYRGEKKRAYTVRMSTKDSTVMNRLPSRVMSQSGMLARKPMLLISSASSCGKLTLALVRSLICPATFSTMPPQMLNSAAMISMP